MAWGGLGAWVLIWLSNLPRVVRVAGEPPFRLRAATYEGPAAGDLLGSVIVPARNEERNIGPCLDALAATDHPRFEVVVVDDRSEDGTRALVEARQAASGLPTPGRRNHTRAELGQGFRGE